MDFAKEGLLQRACAFLVNVPAVKVTDSVFLEMGTKHPRGRESEAESIDDLRELAAAAALQVDREAAAKTIRSFPRSSGACPYGFRPQHL